MNNPTRQNVQGVSKTEPGLSPASRPPSKAKLRSPLTSDPERTSASRSATDQPRSVRNLVSRPNWATRFDDTVVSAAAKMRAGLVSALPVLDARGHAIGTVCEREIVRGVVANAMHPEDVKVAEIMTPGVVTCRSDQTAAEAARLMADRRVDRLLVLDAETDAILGVISAADIVRAQPGIAKMKPQPRQPAN